jgi:hypothetical protein
MTELSTDEQAIVDRFGIFEPEQREAAIMEEVARAICEAEGYPWPDSDGALRGYRRFKYRRLAVAAVAAYRATQPQVDVLLDGELRHTLTVTALDPT